MSEEDIFVGKSLTRKILEEHYVSGSMVPGEDG